MSHFDPHAWIVLPGGHGLHRGDLGPCGDCGGRAFDVRHYRIFMNDAWHDQTLIACPACLPADRRAARASATRSRESVVATLDGLTGELRAAGAGRMIA